MSSFVAKTIPDLAHRARGAAPEMATLSTDAKNRALDSISTALASSASLIFAANRRDLEAAESGGLAAPLLKRLRFDEARLAEVQNGIRSLLSLPDPVGRLLSARELDRGLILRQVTSPLGVIGMVFESRPDALVQISTLCLKSGNCLLLKGGSEALHTNRALYEAIERGAADLPAGWIGLLETRADVDQMLRLDGLLDLIIPRGSNDFVRHIMRNTTIPVLGHADGLCHLFVDAAADLDTALRLAVDSKAQYVAVCNAIETLLVHKDAAAAFLPRAKEALEAAGVSLRGCPRTRELIPCEAATAADWSTEYLDYILSIRVVDSLDAAVDHINTYGSHHTDAIVTTDSAAAERFMDRVDSAGVFWNASTRFADGYRYGLGAEVGISTSKIHARGPVGLEGLVTYKWRLSGAGHRVADYASGTRRLTHRALDA